MKRDSGKGGKRQDQPLRQDTDSARESSVSLDTLDSLVGAFRQPAANQKHGIVAQRVQSRTNKSPVETKTIRYLAEYTATRVVN